MAAQSSIDVPSSSACFPSKFVTLEGDICEITDRTLDVTLIMQHVQDDAAGAMAIFVGTTRNSFQDKVVVKLEYEAHTTLALRTMAKVLTAMRERDNALLRLAVHHRIGNVPVGEASIVVAVSAPHRKASFVACEWVLEQVKLKVQIWKREWYAGEQENDAVWKENFSLSNA